MYALYGSDPFVVYYRTKRVECCTLANNKGGICMKAAVLYELKTPLKVEDLDLDNPKAREVRVKIAANGVCHSDYSVIHGVLRSPLPVVPGHEGAGIVEEVGPDVRLVKPGDHVVLSFAQYGGDWLWRRGAQCDPGLRLGWRGDYCCRGFDGQQVGVCQTVWRDSYG